MSELEKRPTGIYDATGARLIREGGTMRREDNAAIKWPLSIVDEPWGGPFPQGITVRGHNF